MSNFMSLVTKEYEFEDNTLTIKFKRLTRQQMMEISPFLPRDVEEAKDASKNIDLINKAIDILKVNIKESSGLKDGEGNALDFISHIDDMHFFELSSSVAKDLLSESMVNAKKGKPQAEDSTKSTEDTVASDQNQSESAASV